MMRGGGGRGRGRGGGGGGRKKKLRWNSRVSTAAFVWNAGKNWATVNISRRMSHKKSIKQKFVGSTSDKWTGSIQKTTNMLSWPSQEEVLEWTKSFDKVMNNKAGRQVFKEFLRSEYSEENMSFWLACEELKRVEHPDAVEEKARLIYDDYISILSPKEVSLDAQVREIINRKMLEPTRNTFDEAQVQIFTLMQRDSYPRFLNSVVFKRLVQSRTTT